MDVSEFDPLNDPQWPEFLARQPEASIFHTREWLSALWSSYGYKPIAFTHARGRQLTNAIVFCEVKSWLTGFRLVSVPFSDHCEPLADPSDRAKILRFLEGQRKERRWKYIELRPATKGGCGSEHPYFAETQSFALHVIDLRPDLETIYKNFHDSCIRRKVKKAEKESMVYESGRSARQLEQFRELLLLTRRRHRLPPQPASWFQNIVEFLGEGVTIHLLLKEGIPVSSMMTLAYKQTLTYKYGCSNARFSNLGGTPLLFWKVIQQAKSDGMDKFDLGRSDLYDGGLTTFKGHLGAVGSELAYLRSPVKQSGKIPPQSGKRLWAGQALVRLPDPLFAGIGKIAYRHLG